MAFGSWPPGPSDPILDSTEVHVWLAQLRAPLQEVAYYQSLLTAGEHERAQRFHFGEHRDKYIIGRGMLRVLLGRYLQKEPVEIEISYSEYGKPLLPGSELWFNLAHSADLALFAFARDEPVGVDLEGARRIRDASAIAERFFSSAEQNALGDLDPEDMEAAFFRCWARKEAFIKAVGEGLSFPLSDFEVSLAPGAEARLLSIRGNTAEAEKWSLFDLGLSEGFSGALAVEGPGKILRKWRFTTPRGHA